MKSDAQLQRDVIRQLQAALGDHASGIGVSVVDGTVLLSGFATNYMKKYAAERAALQVPGVRVVCEGVTVTAEGGEFLERDDYSVAHKVGVALRQVEQVPEEVLATVEGGWVTLRGEVASTGQRDDALNAVRRGAGIERIYNLITVKPVARGQVAEDTALACRCAPPAERPCNPSGGAPADAI